MYYNPITTSSSSSSRRTTTSLCIHSSYTRFRNITCASMIKAPVCHTFSSMCLEWLFDTITSCCLLLGPVQLQQMAGTSTQPVWATNLSSRNTTIPSWSSAFQLPIVPSLFLTLHLSLSLSFPLSARLVIHFKCINSTFQFMEHTVALLLFCWSPGQFPSPGQSNCNNVFGVLQPAAG